MLADIVLAVLAFVTQFLTAYLGWRITVDGVRENRKKLYESLFVIGGLIGAISIGIAAFRTNGIARDLTQIKINTSQPPIVNVQSPVGLSEDIKRIREEVHELQQRKKPNSKRHHTRTL